MRDLVGSSLKSRLYLMVFLAFLPIAGLIFYINEKQKAYETDAIFQKTMLLAKAAANEEALQLESTRNLLIIISHLFSKSKNDPERFSDLLSELLEHANGYKEFGVLSSDGRLLATSHPRNSSRNYEKHLPLSTLQNSGKMSVIPYKGEHIDGEPVLYVTFPITADRQEETLLAFAAANLNRMNRAILDQLKELPQGSYLTLLDHLQGGIRYNVDAGRWSVSKNFDPELRRQIAKRQSGTLSATDGSGVMRIYGFAPLNSVSANSPVTLVLEEPSLAALEAVQGIFWRNLVLLMISALIAIIFIWRAGNHIILKPVDAMVKASRQLADGLLDARIGNIGAADEFCHLAKVFDEMAASLKMQIEREKQISASLQDSREQFRNLVAYQHETLEEERIRIARELHDQFGQSLTILKMDLSWIKKHLSGNRSMLDQKIGVMAEIIDDTMQNLHAVTAELRPIILDDFGLAAALEWQIEEFGKRTGIACRFENNGYEPDLNKAQATAIFRIFQETLTNIIRHASADRVVVRLKKEENAKEELILQVEDNGRGITQDEIDNPKSYGLLGMRERLHPLNGDVAFEDGSGAGTCVTVRLPLAQKQMTKGIAS